MYIYIWFYECYLLINIHVHPCFSHMHTHTHTCTHIHTHTHTDTHIYIYIYIYISWWICLLRDFCLFKNYLFCSFICVCLRLVAFIWEHMWHKAIVLIDQHECVPVSVGAPFTCPYITNVLWWKHQGWNIQICQSKINNS